MQEPTLPTVALARVLYYTNHDPRTIPPTPIPKALFARVTCWCLVKKKKNSQAMQTDKFWFWILEIIFESKSKDV